MVRIHAVIGTSFRISATSSETAGCSSLFRPPEALQSLCSCPEEGRGSALIQVNEFLVVRGTVRLHARDAHIQHADRDGQKSTFDIGFNGVARIFRTSSLIRHMTWMEVRIHAPSITGCAAYIL